MGYQVTPECMLSTVFKMSSLVGTCITIPQNLPFIYLWPSKGKVWLQDRQLSKWGNNHSGNKKLGVDNFLK